MNATVVNNALGALELLVNDAQEVLWQVQGEIFHNVRVERDSYLDNPRGALASHLEHLHDVLLVVLEAAEMPQSRALLVDKWAEYTKDGLKKTKEYFEYESSESPALTFMERQIDGLRMSVKNEVSTQQAWDLSRLEGMLDRTAVLVHRKKHPLKDEKALKHFMHDYLRAFFPDFVPKPEIGGVIKKFNPDAEYATFKQQSNSRSSTTGRKRPQLSVESSRTQRDIRDRKIGPDSMLLSIRRNRSYPRASSNTI